MKPDSSLFTKRFYEIGDGWSVENEKKGKAALNICKSKLKKQITKDKGAESKEIQNSLIRCLADRNIQVQEIIRLKHPVN